MSDVLRKEDRLLDATEKGGHPSPANLVRLFKSSWAALISGADIVARLTLNSCQSSSTRCRKNRKF